MQKRWYINISLFMMVFLACALMVAAAQSDSTPTPLPTPTPTPSAIEVTDSVRLEDQTTTEEFQQPKLSVYVSIPVMTGADSAVADPFNQAVADIVAENVTAFKDGLIQSEATATPIPEIAEFPSFIQLTYEVFIADNDLISIRFHVTFYGAGAAHPGSYSVPLNYDLGTARVLELADLFQPDSPYLEVLSVYAFDTLTQADMLFFPEGVEPRPENYRSWNITQDGLLLTFDEYQVAPYAAGPQQVVVPYSALTRIINPDGVLASFTSS
jgi:hypothetical protein